MAYKVKGVQKMGRKVEYRVFGSYKSKAKAEYKANEVRGEIKSIKEQFPNSKIYKNKIFVVKE